MIGLRDEKGHAGKMARWCLFRGDSKNTRVVTPMELK